MSRGLLFSGHSAETLYNRLHVQASAITAKLIAAVQNKPKTSLDPSDPKSVPKPYCFLAPKVDGRPCTYRQVGLLLSNSTTRMCL